MGEAENGRRGVFSLSLFPASPRPSISKSRHSLVVPHEQLGIFFQDAVGDLIGHGDDDGVVALLPGFLESGADRFQTENLEFLLGCLVFLELLEQLGFRSYLDSFHEIISH
jgi:hypothetical protein